MPKVEVRIEHVSDGIKREPVPPRSWIHCTNGHRICFCAEGIEPGSINWSSRLSDWQQRPRQIGEPFSKGFACDECGAPWEIVIPEAFEAAKKRGD